MSTTYRLPNFQPAHSQINRENTLFPAQFQQIYKCSLTDEIHFVNAMLKALLESIYIILSIMLIFVSLRRMYIVHSVIVLTG